jgi:hypothetical protein
MAAKQSRVSFWNISRTGHSLAAIHCPSGAADTAARASAMAFWHNASNCRSKTSLSIQPPGMSFPTLFYLTLAKIHGHTRLTRGAGWKRLMSWIGRII